MDDLYESFAEDYDLFGSPEEYVGKEYDFFTRLFELYNIESVLDCSCGTGRHLFAFHQMGMQVAGSDFSASMLDVARRYLERKDLRVPLKQCDFRYLERSFDERFDAVVCLSTSLPHLHSDEDLIKALRSMHMRLKMGGILVLTQGTTERNLREVPPIEVIVNNQEFSRIFVKEVVENRFLDIHILDLFHSFLRNEHKQHDMRYRLLFADEYRNLLERAGFSKTTVVGDYDMTPYSSETSERLIVIAER